MIGGIGHLKRIPDILIGGLLLGMLILLFSFVLKSTATTRLRIVETQRSLDHAHDVTSCLREIALHLKDAEAQERGYLLSPAIDLRKTFQANCDDLNGDLIELDRSTASSSAEHRESAELIPMISRRIADLKAQVDSAPVARASTPFDVDEDHVLDSLITAMRSREYRLVEDRTNAAQDAIVVTEARITAAIWMVITIIGGCFAVVVYHLFRRTRTERSLTAANNLLTLERESLRAVSHFLSDVVNADFDVTEIMKLVAERTRVLTVATGAVIEMLDGSELVYTAATGELAGSAGTRVAVDGSLAGMALDTREILRADDTETDHRVNRAACRKLNIRSMVVVPLLMNGIPFGVLKVSASTPNAFDNHAVDILELMASVIATAMSRASQFQANEALLVERTEAVESLRAAKAEVTQQLANVEDLNVVLQFQYQELQKANDQLEALATTDGLTGLKNHRAFQERLSEEIQRAARYGTPLSVVLLDVDNFKLFNDTFGHPAGDDVLYRVARTMENVKRDTDLAARYGGEEFVFVLPLNDGDAAAVLAERCRTDIEMVAWDKRAITASFGVASMTSANETPASLIARADAALYAAKSAGRNRVSRDGAQEKTILRLAA